MKSFERLSTDSMPVTTGKAMFFSFNLDTVPKRERIQRTRAHSRTEIVISKRKHDTIPDKVFVRYVPDTLSQDSITNRYRKALADANIPLPFRIVKDRQLEIFEEGFSLSPSVPKEESLAPTGRNSIVTEWMRFAPILRYAAVLDNVRPYLYFQIGPQILFSFALTLITSAAFWMMYRSMRSQQRLMDLKNDFISNITHELKTPVTTVSVALEALRNFKGLENPQTTREYLDIAQGELTRLTLLTDKVLKTAVFDNPGVTIENEPVDLHKTVDQILHSMKLIFEKQKAHVTFDRHGNSFTIRGGSVHLTNVVYNLLDNALKYSFGEPNISISLQEDDNKVVLKIADKGIGIPAEYKKKIFEKFFRVPTGDVHNIKGYGLGLSYVDSVVRSHNGLIEVVSTPGEGSVFTISLPKGM
jgi:signal transduction histidine kinase